MNAKDMRFGRQSRDELTRILATYLLELSVAGREAVKDARAEMNSLSARIEGISALNRKRFSLAAGIVKAEEILGIRAA